MSWSLRLGRIVGIPLFVHWTFLVFLGWIVLAQWGQSHDVMVALVGGLFVVTLFGCVVLHELGHSLMARRFGVPTTDITLLPIGGVARLSRIPERPREELAIALAGPAVNIVVAALLYLVFQVRFPANTSDPLHLVQGGFWPRILEVNTFLAAFNMIPAFPMDGGRVLRALLAMRLPYVQATRLAASVGQALAIGFAFFGISYNPFLMLIALFVWIGAEAEARLVEERVALRDLHVRDAMLTEYHSVDPDETLGHAADLLLAGTQHNFPVVSSCDEGFQALLTRAELMAGLAAGGRDGRIGDHAKTQIPSVDASGSLAEAVTRLQEQKLPCLQVIQNGEPVGLLSLENIGEYLLVRAALAGSGGVTSGPGQRMIATSG